MSQTNPPTDRVSDPDSLPSSDASRPNTSPPEPTTPNPPQAETLDATVADDQAAPELQNLTTGKYDPKKFQDEARVKITYWLLALLTLLIICTFVLLYKVSGDVTFDKIQTLLNMLLGPVVALVSAATGFYFGEKSVSRHDGG